MANSDDDMDNVEICEIIGQSQSESDDEQSEEVGALLASKLIEGFVLLQSCCPACNTPLVKAMLNITTEIKTEEKKNDSDNDRDVKRVEPINGVSFCANCCAHVLTNKEEIQTIHEAAALSGHLKGEILMVMSDDEDILVMDSAITCSQEW